MEKHRLFKDNWVDACHREWHPSEMRTEHIENTISMLENNASAYVESYVKYLDKSISGLSITKTMQATTEAEISRIWNMDSVRWVRSTPMYKALKAELDRRRAEEARAEANRIIQEAARQKCSICLHGQGEVSMNELKALAKKMDDNEKVGLAKVMRAIVEGRYKITPCGQILEL